MEAKNKNYALETLEKLIEASKGAVDLLIEEIGKPLIEEDDEFKYLRRRKTTYY